MSPQYHHSNYRDGQVYLKSLQKLSPLHYYPSSSPRDFKDVMDYCYLEIGSDLMIHTGLTLNTKGHLPSVSANTTSKL